jgi:SPP1 gp7 family putative phage head morphogenesis protein
MPAMATPESSVQATHGGFDAAGLQRPVQRAVPYSEWASRVRLGANLDVRRIDAAIRMADAGVMWPITDMARESLGLNPHAQGILGKRLVPLSTADWDVSPAEGDGVSARDAARIATFVRTVLRGLDMAQAIHDLSFGFLDARAGLEVEWHQVNRMLVPTCLHWIVPQRLSFDRNRSLVVVDRWSDTGGFVQRGPALSDEPGRFLQFLPRMFGDLQEREGLSPRYIYWLFFDRFGWRHRILLTESFGIPWRIVETDISETFSNTAMPRKDGDPESSLGYAAKESDDVTTEGVWVGLPGQKMKVEYPPADLESFFGQTSDQILARLEVLTLHTSSTTGSGDGASRAGLVVLKNAEETLYAHGGRAISGVFQRQLVDRMVEINFGASALPLSPTFQLRTAPERDRKAELERADLLVNKLGVPLGRAELYEASGFHPPSPGEDLVERAPTPAPLLPGQPAAAPQPGNALPAAPKPQEAASDDPLGAFKDLLDSAEINDQEDAADEEASAGFARLAKVRTAQPNVANGSPEVIVTRGAQEGVRQVSKWADELLDVADGPDEGRIYRRISRAGSLLDVGPLARALERRILHGVMLGALDADWEAESDKALKPPAFAGVAGAAVGVKNFATMPFGEALRAFAKRQILTRPDFDRLAAAARRRAFTVAGLAQRDMVATAHDELSKALEAGADLRSFSKALAARFDSAGWSKLNPSHVETVFRNGVMGSYSDGRRAQMTQPAVLAARPYWQILGVDDSRTRPNHKAALGKVLAADDPFFDRSGPPFGHNCRCRARSLSDKDLERMGLKPTVGAQLRGLPDEGWSSEGRLVR